MGEFTGINVTGCIGGTSIQENIRTLKNGNIHIVVGTPGRVHDMINKKIFKTDYLRLFVLDEADEMLKIGFKENI